MHDSDGRHDRFKKSANPMMTTPTNHSMVKVKLLAVGAILMISTHVHAAYTVMDDDLYPESHIQARLAPRTEQAKTVPFARQRSILGPMGRASLDAMLPLMQNANVRIVGRPDASIHSGGGVTLADNRATNIRDYLVKQGVPLAAIKIEVDNSPNPQQNGSTYPSDVYISTMVATRAAMVTPQPQAEYTPPAQALANPATCAAPAPDGANAELIRHINNAVQSGQMSPMVALKLLENLAPKAPKAPKWEILATDMTLQNTFARWGKLAGWEVKWQDIPDIKNPGYVMLPESDFLAAASNVLKQATRAAKAAGIEMSAKAYPNRVLVISKVTNK